LTVAGAEVLFISYTGLLEPLGASQVVPYVRGLARKGHRMAVLSFERTMPHDRALEPMRATLAAEGVDWVPLRYHKRPPLASTLADVAAGILHARRFLRRGLRLVHARSHVPALIAHYLLRRHRVPFVFDLRGRMADEYADAGIWPAGGWMYRQVEQWEATFVKEAAGTVVLTDRFGADLHERATRLAVIPCAVDLTRFQPRRADFLPPFDLVYAGSWSGLYLADEVLRFFVRLRELRPSARLLLLVPRAAELRGLPPGVEARTARPEEVPALLATARAGISLRRPGRAQVAASPVKISEYFACGLPVLTSMGVGDLDVLVPQRRIGVVLRGFGEGEMREGAASLIQLLDDPDVARRCRAVAEERYALESAVDAYDRLYRSVLGNG
jgi:glycosyltransferase involved in cell wall biosynthesis